MKAGLGLGAMRVRTLIVLRTLLVCNGALLIALGAIIGAYMERPAGVYFAFACWISAAGVLYAARVAERIYIRRRG